jgi:hypothetical protein
MNLRLRIGERSRNGYYSALSEMNTVVSGSGSAREKETYPAARMTSAALRDCSSNPEVWDLSLLSAFELPGALLLLNLKCLSRMTTTSSLPKNRT